MIALRTIVAAGCDAGRFGRLAAPLLEQEVGAPTLLVAELAEDAFLLGRHQRAAVALTAPPDDAPPRRRAGGGKTLRVMAGAVGVLLAVAPGGWPEPLDPDKVLNRCVRGLLRGLPRVGPAGAAHYFGRDFVSMRQHQVAAVSQEGSPGGTLLFEAVIAARAPLALPAGLSGYPEHPDHRMPGPPHGDLGDPGFSRLAGAVIDGYASLLGATPSPEPAIPEPGPPLEPPVAEDEAGLAWSALLPIPIGFLQAGVRAEGDRIAEVRLRGDFIAPAFAVDRLEKALEGKRLSFDVLGPEIDGVFGARAAPIVGVTDLRVLCDAILDAGRAARRA
jgi:hypothetical protein